MQTFFFGMFYLPLSLFDNRENYGCSLALGDFFYLGGAAVVVMSDWHNGFYMGQGVLICGADFLLYVALNRP